MQIQGKFNFEYSFWYSWAILECKYLGSSSMCMFKMQDYKLGQRMDLERMTCQINVKDTTEEKANPRVLPKEGECN